MSKPIKKPHMVHVREVSPSYDAMVVAMAEALEERICECSDTVDASSRKFFEQCGRCEALALYREWKK